MYTRDEIIERAASGLRKMEITPDAFLCSQIWTDDNVLGIKVLYTDCEIDFIWNSSLTHECIFMPIWHNERSSHPYESKKFFQGWDDCKF